MTAELKGTWGTDGLKTTCGRRRAFDVEVAGSDASKLALRQGEHAPVWVMRCHIWVDNGPLSSLIEPGLLRVYLRAADYEGSALVPVSAAQLLRERSELHVAAYTPILPTAQRIEGLALLEGADEDKPGRVILDGSFLRISGKSALFRIKTATRTRELWVPLSQLMARREPHGGCKLSLPQWLAEKENLSSLKSF